MRRGATILCAVILFSIVAPRQASAGAWSSFVAWLSNLDPKSFGLGTELPVNCLPDKEPQVGQGQESDLEKKCVYPNSKRPVLVKVSTFLAVGPNKDHVGTMYVVPAVGLAEWRLKRVYPAAGAGIIHVGGVPGGELTRELLQARVSVPTGKGTAIRFDYNFIPRGFPAGAFEAGAPETGAESAIAIALAFLR
jgi:hypothetical protein